MDSDHRLIVDPATGVTDASTDPAVQRVVRTASQTFGSEEKAQRWLRRPTQALAGASPLEIACSGDGGIQKVVDLLKRIDHGLSV